MALRWSIRNIMGFKRNPDDYYVPVENKKGSKVFDIQPITKHLVYETMIVGLSEITESNIAPEPVLLVVPKLVSLNSLRIYLFVPLILRYPPLTEGSKFCN